MHTPEHTEPTAPAPHRASFRFGVTIAAVTLLVRGVASAGQSCDPAALCPSTGPCVISTSSTWTTACALDFGARPVTVASGTTLQVQAGSTLSLQTSGPLTVAGTLRAPTGHIELRGGDDVTVAGLLDVQTTVVGLAQVRIAGRKTLSVSGTITATGGDSNEIDLEGCAVTIDGTVDASGPHGKVQLTYHGTYDQTGSVKGDPTKVAPVTMHCPDDGQGHCVTAPGGVACDGQGLCDGSGGAVVSPHAQVFAELLQPCGQCGDYVVLAAGMPCDDRDPCTQGDACSPEGGCVATQLEDCDDQNPCTLDTCDGSGVCQHALRGVNPTTGAFTPDQCLYSQAAVVSEQGYKQPSGRSSGFGVALSSAGSDLVVGANAFVSGTSPKGRAYLFDGDSWALKQTFTSPIGTSSLFGSPLADAGGLPLIARIGYGERGAVYLFDPTDGGLLATLTEPVAGDATFGSSIAADGNNILVGAQNRPAAYLFDLGGDWQLTFQPDPADGTFQFVRSVALLPWRAAVTFAGDTKTVTYVFSSLDGQIVSRFPVTGADATFWGARATAIGTDKFAVSQPYGANQTVTIRSIGDAAFVQTIPNPGTQIPFALDFGMGLAATRTAVVVGSPYNHAAYLFDATSGRRITTLSVAPSASNDRFAEAVAAVGDKIAVGYSDVQTCSLTDSCANSAVYVYEPRCGNRRLDAGETLDDGNTRDDDCVRSDCTQKPADSACMNAGKLGMCSPTGHCDVPSTASTLVASAAATSPEHVCQVGKRFTVGCNATFHMWQLQGVDHVCVAP